MRIKMPDVTSRKELRGAACSSEFLFIVQWCITASKLILFYYEKVNYKLKKFEAIFIIRFFD